MESERILERVSMLGDSDADTGADA
jgi:hypothetical protein